VPEEIFMSLPGEGINGGHKPMKDLKEAVAKTAGLAWCEPPVDRSGRARYPFDSVYFNGVKS
jgi:hypothetical protein